MPEPERHSPTHKCHVQHGTSKPINTNSHETNQTADALHQKPGERYSKYEAFRYLCERQAVHSSDQSRNHTGPFTVTITELSVDWGWHRHTVTAFLGKLVALDYLTVEKTQTGFSLLLNDLCVPDL